MNINRTITLTTDWRTRDPYLAVFKSQILQKVSNITLLDLVHTLPLKQYEQASFLLGGAFPYFPEASIHIILVGSTTSHKATPYLLVYKGHYFIAEETTALSLLVADDFENEYQFYQFPVDESSQVLSKIIQLTQWVMDGVYEQYLTIPQKVYPVMRNIPLVEPSFDGTSIKGAIAYIDAHANAVTNIPIEMADHIVNKLFTAFCGKGNHLKITKYHEERNFKEKEVYFMKNSLGYLEITFNQGNIAFLCNLKVNDLVEIKVNEL